MRHDLRRVPLGPSPSVKRLEGSPDSCQRQGALAPTDGERQLCTHQPVPFHRSLVYSVLWSTYKVYSV